jgi:hypothetical protein
MNYKNVIPFDGREQDSFRDSEGCCVVLPSTTTVPMIGPLELQSATTGPKKTPAAGVEVLFEQLEYLIQFADQEGDRLDRVKAILLETFN